MSERHESKAQHCGDLKCISCNADAERAEARAGETSPHESDRPGGAVYRITFGAVEYRGQLDPWLAVNADALESVLDDDDLARIRSLREGERYSPELARPMACSFTCLREAQRSKAAARWYAKGDDDHASIERDFEPPHRTPEGRTYLGEVLGCVYRTEEMPARPRAEKIAAMLNLATHRGASAGTGRRCQACDQVGDDVGELPDTLPLCAQCAKAHRMGYRCGEEMATWSDEVVKLRSVAEAARAFFSQPYDNGQWETRLRDAVRALAESGERPSDVVKDETTG